MFSRFHLIPERHGRTDRQTDGQICYINIARQYADARCKLLKQPENVRTLKLYVNSPLTPCQQTV